MQIQSNVPLKEFTTMRLGGPARHLVIVNSRDELVQTVAWAEEQSLPIFVLGEGSNVIVRDQGFNGLIIVNRITGFDADEDGPDHVLLKIGAGENWDEAVKRSVDMGLSGIEAMSYIPGTAGATPVQNVGAYGQEISDTFVELEAYDLLTHGFVRIRKDECGFSYRNSNFKSTEERRYIIVSVILRLSREPLSPPFYEALQRYFDDNGITSGFTPQSIRDAVIAIRTKKLPDPKQVANTGSFFKNPIVTGPVYEKLAAEFPEIRGYDMPDGRVKLAAGWLIEQAGLKGASAHGMKTYENNALVFVNESAQTYQDLLGFKNEVTQKVQAKFGITLEQEPELL
jgi:UDP-N-acetylmuramate dehydrogenase